MSSDEEKRLQKKSRIMLVSLVLLFAAPLLFATILYMFRDNLPIPGPAHHGELITPARLVEQLHLLTLDGDALDAAFLRGKWTLVYISGESCDEACRTSLINTRQMRLALGRHMERVQRLYVQHDTGNAAALNTLTREHPLLVAATASRVAMTELHRQFGEAGHIYLVDPLGNVLIRYAPDVQPKDLKKDIKRLLKVSRIG